ncbi:hypothetical protein A3D78_04580 [Candidatus Gottesmanbacteria bacterium RIFCSPHIGHO2_02_FULL_39_14]|uniref:Ribbon-helix-helix protein CopG domain-containing protein n=2 Tax=Candidatus Gottesmaniibacteriota TaxID=1752720 RepID=A0A1F6A340_9BACT|nr:MAG: hypothetical protein A2153_03590 [Candidatus Gottesmanbacteria bacterium RBG_16_38_7b]OGG19123.1 MAG: hypothetical protein A3D78_04580 [Candidatus Gottesmanbacteria bacterium RIFCSPHIGHO2_02_FULL_39_14]
MADMVKTTIMLPEDILREAKITAVNEKTTLSKVIRESLETRLGKTIRTRNIKQNKDPLRFLGAFSIGIKVPYKHRADLYEEHLKRKMGF